jgi:hypothetical protein
MLDCWQLMSWPNRFRILLAFVTLPTFSSIATAGDRKAEALRHHDIGAQLYLSGAYARAVRELEMAYALDPDPVLLYDIAQAHRRNGSADQAILFYGRYLDALPNAPKRAEVEKRIKELEESSRKAKEETALPPRPIGPPLAAYPALPPARPLPPKSTEPTSQDLVMSPPTTKSAEPPSVRILAELGVALPILAGSDIKPAGLLCVGFSAAYVVHLAEERLLELGISANWSPLSFERYDHNLKRGTGEQGESNLISLFANATLRLPTTRALYIGPSAGLGIVWWSGLEKADNPFAGGQTSSGPVPMPAVQARFDVMWTPAPAFFAGTGLGGSFSKTTSAGLKEEISGVLRFEASGFVGVGF